MVEITDVYIEYQRALARFNNRPYRVPKDWDKVWSKLNEKSLYNLEMITKAFSTRWHNIDIGNYFDCGFQLLGKKFTYVNFFERKIILLYIENDKQKKRKTTSIVEAMNESLGFIENWMEKHEKRDDLSIYSCYSRMKVDGVSAPIKHYLDNKIDKYMLTLLIKEKYLQLKDHEKIMIPLVIENYRKYSNELNEMEAI